MAVSRKTWLMLSATALLVPTAAEAKSSDNAAVSATPEAPAQDSSQTGSSAGSSSDAQTTGIQDIVVTAQQRGENLQKAAIAVAVVTGDRLIDNGVRGIDTLGKLVPAFVVASSSQGNLVFIRGVGNFSFTPNSDPATAYNFDGVYIGRSSATVGL